MTTRPHLPHRQSAISKRLALVAIVLLPLTATASPSVLQDSVEYARVLSSVPIAGRPIARRECQRLGGSQPEAHNGFGAVLGGLTGALVGSRFGGGHGRDASTVVGAIGGAMLGDRLGGGDDDGAEQCNTVYEPGPPQGYQVTYDYQGRRATVVLRHPPGDFLRLHRRVTLED